MKKLLLVLGFVVLSTVARAETGFVLPNLEATYFYDFESKALILGGSSKVLIAGDFDGRIGQYADKTTLTLSYDLRNLAKYGLNVRYAWESWNLTIGGGVAYNFVSNNLSFHLMSVLLQIGF